MNIDIRNLQKWLNEEQEAPIDRQALARVLAMAEQPAQQEPCGWQFFQDGKWHNGMEINDHRANTEAAGIPVRDVYPSPPAQPSKPWVRLTPEQRATIAEANNMLVDDDLFDAIEAELKEKNA